VGGGEKKRLHTKTETGVEGKERPGQAQDVPRPKLDLLFARQGGSTGIKKERPFKKCITILLSQTENRTL